MKSSVRILPKNELPKGSRYKYIAFKNAFVVAASELLGNMVIETSNPDNEGVYLCKTLNQKRGERWGKVRICSVSRRYVTVETV